MSRRRRLGSAALEFALTLPFLLYVAVGVVELSLLMHRTHVVTRAARDAGRTGAVVIEGPEPTGELIEAAAVEHARFALGAAGIPCADDCGIDADWFEDGGWHLLRVTITLPYQPVSGVIPGIPHQTRGQFVVLTQQQAF